MQHRRYPPGGSNALIQVPDPSNCCTKASGCLIDCNREHFQILQPSIGCTLKPFVLSFCFCGLVDAYVHFCFKACDVFEDTRPEFCPLWASSFVSVSVTEVSLHACGPGSGGDNPRSK